MNNTLKKASKYFERKKIIIKDEWLSQSIEFYNMSNLTGNIIDFLIQNWLETDIKETTIPKSLPILEHESGCFLADHIFQINSIRRIDISFYSQYITLTEKKKDLSSIYRDNGENQDEESEFNSMSIDSKPKKRCLMLELFDGENTYFCVELEVIDFISESTPPGSKVHISKNIEFCKGIIFIKKSSIVLLGGEVESLCKTNSILNILKSELKLLSQPLPLSLKKDESNTSYKTQKDEIKMSKKIPQISRIIINDSIVPLDTPNLSKYTINSNSKDKENIDTKKSLTNIDKDGGISTLHKLQKNKSSMENLRHISLTEQSEKSNDYSIQNDSLEHYPILSKKTSYNPNFEFNNKKELSIILPNDASRIFSSNSHEKKNIDIYDRENTLKRQCKDNRNFFDTTFIDLKKPKIPSIEDILPSETITSIQEAQNLASISFEIYNATVKGNVLRITERLKIEENLWTMKVLIIDDDGSVLECSIANTVIQGFIEMTPEEGLRLKNSNFLRRKREARDRLNCFEDRLKLKNLIFNIRIYPSPNIMPTINKIQTLDQFMCKKH
uniref:RecQ-mediated genome instability protein 1 n=1 Tax=Strongyloides stercoralis TaxID=6248 RepID=A0A0K0EEV9_STRER